MNFEIEFHPVGDATKAGDAITVRYEQNGVYKIMVIDGGTDQSGANLVGHIRRYYGNDVVIADVVSTHPDSDHACGLRQVLKTFTVERLWVHGLWYHAPDIIGLFADKRFTVDGLARKIKEAYPVIAELLELAESNGVNVYEPFVGAKIGPFTVLSPNEPTYQHLIPQFRKTPDPDVELLKLREIWIGSKEPSGALGALFGWAAEKMAQFTNEFWNIELLRENGVTAAENESSVVLYGDFGVAKIILTADAGNNALHWACDNAELLKLDISAANLIQVPHHGSRRNVSPSVLNRLVGPPLPYGAAEKKSAIASVPKDDEKHPRKMVVNAFTRRGAGVRKTQGAYYRYSVGMPRANEGPARPFPFFDEVEEYD